MNYHDDDYDNYHDELNLVFFVKDTMAEKKFE